MNILSRCKALYVVPIDEFFVNYVWVCKKIRAGVLHPPIPLPLHPPPSPPHRALVILITKH